MKMKKKEIGLVICFTSLCLTTTFAQKVTIDAEFRPRAEVRDGFNQPLVSDYGTSNNRAAGLILQRTRLGLSYESNSLDAKIVLQDSRTFGEIDTKGGQIKADTTNVLGIYEAWAQVLVLPGTSFKIGRQGLQFEDGRLFSLSSWSNTGYAHDMGQLKFSIPSFDAQVGYAFNNKNTYNYDSIYNIAKMYKQLAFLHVSKSIVNGLDVSGLFVDEGFQQNSSKSASTSSSSTNLNLYHRYTTGGTVNFKNDSLPFNLLFTGYYQFGNSAQGVDLSAYLLALKANYNIFSKLSINAGVDYYSGSSSTIDATKQNTFQKLPYASNHNFDGFMEYWATIPTGGLIDYSAGLSYAFTKTLSLDGTYYLNYLAKDMQVTNSVTKVKQDVPNNIGSEVDLVLNYKMSEETAVQLGWCTYFATDGTKLLKNKNTEVGYKLPQYAYVMLTIKPKFLVSK
ncbi:MAG: hypothetical protein P4L28_01005 [Paludibacteraceae bacterium]|nr:hypothetical protein [Paludibacteraceae bacterium]